MRRLGILCSIFFPLFALAAPKGGDVSAADLERAKQTAQTLCVACHGVDGNSPLPANPIIAGQHREYILEQLQAFKSVDGKPQARQNATMLAMTAGLSPEDMRALALYFSSQKMTPQAATDQKLAAAGMVIWRRGNANKGVPACAGCHGPAGAGLPAQYPRLAGQFAEYTEAQLKAFRSEERANDEGAVMREIADRLSDKDIKALAQAIAGMRSQD